jgi:hypothetical protein
VTRRLLGRLPAVPFPTPRQAAVYVAVALSTGIILGTAIGPGSGAAKSLLVGKPVSAATSGAAAAPAPPASAPLEAPSGDLASDAPAPAADDGAAASALADTAAQAAEPSVPLDESTPVGEPAPAPAPEKAPSDANDLAGTVVHTNLQAKSYTLATSQAELIVVHAKKLPDPGANLKAKVKHLQNGTMSEVSSKKKSSQRTAKLRGTVTYVADDAHSYTVSVRGVSLLVTAPDAAPAGERPKLRSLVALEVRLEDPPPDATVPVIVRETSLKLEGDATGPVELEGTVGAVDAAARTITLSADDRRDTQKDLTVSVPDAIDLSKLKKDDVLIATADIGPQGTYALTGSWEDGNVKLADDPASALGDQAP